MTYARKTSKRIGTRKLRRKDKQSKWKRGAKALMNGKGGHGQIGDLNLVVNSRRPKHVPKIPYEKPPPASHMMVSLAVLFDEAEGEGQ